MTGYVFDIDDTLYCREDLIWQAANEAAEGVLSDRPGFIDLFYVLSDENFPLVESGAITAQESNIWRFEQCLQRNGVTRSRERGVLAARLYTDLQNHITLSAPLASLLDHLKEEGYLLGVLTNGETKHQWEKYHMLDLGRWIPEDMVVVSGQVGATKPDPAIYRIAQQRMHLPADNLWMIGDSYGGDIKGASLAGWHSIWINRRNAPTQDITPDLIFRNEYDMTDYFLQKNRKP